jgi:two-component system, cell cycle sensor histidine kinase and response regulator CckA
MTSAAVQTGTERIRVLIVEDSPDDAELITLELKRGGYDVHCVRVDDVASMRQALDESDWDLILSDYSMPRFSVKEALNVVEQKGVDVPFVIVSATIGEEAAVEAMKAGAHDYVLKHRLSRLVPAIKRELRESAVRRERRHLEEQLRHAQKLESLGLLAGGVAHDFNNLLTGILGNASLALDSISPESELQMMLQGIVKSAERAADLTRQLLAYAGKGKFVVAKVDVSALVRDISELIRSSVPRTLELDLKLAYELPPVEGDPTQIQQLVMNLILNAVEATSDRRGVVRVVTRVRHITARDITSRFRPDTPQPGVYVEIEVSDSGCGMSPDVEAQIFDPFFTTKFTGRGLGLAAALGIVRGHRGAIRVETREGAGSTFTVLLPGIGGTAAAQRRVEQYTPASRTDEGAILIIDDEEMVRRAARAALEHYGYTVFEAMDGRDGADLFSRLQDRITAVLLDLTMPRMDGHDVWRYIRRVCPDMKIVISSGFDESEARQQFIEEPDLVFLKKPYTASSLVRTLRVALKK